MSEEISRKIEDNEFYQEALKLSQYYGSRILEEIDTGKAFNKIYDTNLLKEFLNYKPQIKNNMNILTQEAIEKEIKNLHSKRELLERKKEQAIEDLTVSNLGLQETKKQIETLEIDLKRLSQTTIMGSQDTGYAIRPTGYKTQNEEGFLGTTRNM